MRWKKVTLIGVGLLGGSLGLALKKRRLAGRVTGFVRRKETIAECRKRRALDEATLDLQAAVRDADLVIFCTPLAQMRLLVKAALPALKKGAIVTDVGSTKESVVKDLETLVTRAGGHFVGSHPMAGSEKTGVQAAKEDLFEGAVCVVTPTRKTPVAAVRKVEAFWQDVGCSVLKMTARRHDQLVSRCSHLTHLLAATLAGYVLDPKHGVDQQQLCASGFRDATRVASGSAEMWRDIAMANRSNLSRSVTELIRDLEKFQRLLNKADAHGMEAFFARAKERRDNWVRGKAPISNIQ